MPVTENLWLALRRFGTVQRLSLRTFWIDALCINQTDVSERNSQVQRMADIFANGKCTLVWLGEATENFQIVKKFIVHLAYLALGRTIFKNGNPRNFGDLISVAACYNTSEAGQWLDRYCRWWQSKFDKENLLWSALSEFLQLAWFRRTWIVQEAVLARRVRVHVGLHQFRGHMFAIALEGVHIHLDSHPYLLNHPEAMEGLRAVDFLCRTATLRWTANPWSSFRPLIFTRLFMESSAQRRVRLYSQQLEVLIGYTIHTRQTDPRDRVFALLSLALIEGDQRFPVDYDLPTSEVFVKVAHFCLEVLKSPSILSLAGTEIHGREWSSLPSWVPDLSQRSTHGRPPQSMIDGQVLDCATAMEFAAHIRDHNTVEVRATILANVRSVVAPLQDDPQDLFHWFQECEALENKCQEVFLVPGDSFDAACWRTLAWNLGTPDSYNSYRAFRTVHQNAAESNDTDEGTRKNAVEFQTRFRSLAYGLRKAMMITDSGRLVSGPIASQAEDKICIIAGARVPFVLRRTDDGNAYRLVGECFVYGLTNGEVRDVDNLIFENIELR